jgi:hemin uptake protein HemP
LAATVREHAMFEQSPATTSPLNVIMRAAAVDRPVQPGVAQRIDSGRLLGGGHELVIEHAGQEYRLRLTRNDKLILTK